MHGLLEGDPVYWEPGKLKLRLFHQHSKQALAVSRERGRHYQFGREMILIPIHTVYRQEATRVGLPTIRGDTPAQLSHSTSTFILPLLTPSIPLSPLAGGDRSGSGEQSGVVGHGGGEGANAQWPKLHQRQGGGGD